MSKISFTRCWTATNKYSKNRWKIEIWNFSVSDHNHSLNDDRFFSHHFFLFLSYGREREKIIGGQRETELWNFWYREKSLFLSISHTLREICHKIFFVYIGTIIFCRFDANYILFIRGRTWDEESHRGLALARNNSTGH